MTGKAAAAPGLDGQDVSVMEAPHVELAGGGGPPGPVRIAVDNDTALPADPLATIVVEGNRILAFENQTSR